MIFNLLELYYHVRLSKCQNMTMDQFLFNIKMVLSYQRLVYSHECSRSITQITQFISQLLSIIMNNKMFFANHRKRIFTAQHIIILDISIALWYWATNQSIAIAFISHRAYQPLRRYSEYFALANICALNDLWIKPNLNYI